MMDTFTRHKMELAIWILSSLSVGFLWGHIVGKDVRIKDYIKRNKARESGLRIVKKDK